MNSGIGAEAGRLRLDRLRRKVLAAFRAGDLSAAEAACMRLVELAPNHADAWFLAALCAMKRGQLAVALERFDRATLLDAGRPDYWAHRSRCLEALGRHEDARGSCDRAMALPGADAETHDTLGHVLVRLGRYPQAVAEFRAAVRAQPQQARFHYNLATALMHSGDLTAAAAGFERVLELEPDQGWAHLALAQLLDGPPPPGRIERLEAALERARGNVDRDLLIRQALARTLELSGDTAAAFAHWKTGKSAKKAQLGYTIAEDARIFAAFETLFESAAVADPRLGAPSNAPIFVVGMPRTGTTLLERILSSHSAVASGGEMACFAQAVKELGGGRGATFIDIEALGAALAADPAELGRRYLAHARVTVEDSERFVDKHPLNFFFVGFIRRALPNAKIVCMHRDPLDTCLANFRQLFSLGGSYRYALSLEDTAEYLAMFEKLMEQWDRLFPDAIYPLQYESLVADQEGEIRRLFEFIELEFEPEVLNFHRNAAPVYTTSLVQVRHPIHQDSVGAWRRYTQELEPCRRRLEALGVQMD